MVAQNHKGDKVLVTGATGYLGAHVVSQLLKRGYHVRAAVRNQKKGELLANIFSAHKERLEFVLIDLSKPDSFNGIMEGLTGVFHVAAPLPGSLKTSVKEDFLDPAIEGNLGLLRAAAKVPSIKRVVITSSIAALVELTSSDTSHVFTDKDWNSWTYETAKALEGPHADIMAYAASKKLAEKAAFDFVVNEKPAFDVVTILPSFMFGPAEGVAEVMRDVSSLHIIYDYITTKKEIQPSLPFYQEVDVRDVALAHILAFENPKASNQRYIVSAEPFAFSEIVEFAHEEFKGKTTPPPLENVPPLPQFLKFDNSKSKSELGLVYRSKNETFRDSIVNLLALKQQGKLN